MSPAEFPKLTSPKSLIERIFKAEETKRLEANQIRIKEIIEDRQAEGAPFGTYVAIGMLNAISDFRRLIEKGNDIGAIDESLGKQLSAFVLFDDELKITSGKILEAVAFMIPERLQAILKSKERIMKERELTPQEVNQIAHEYVGPMLEAKNTHLNEIRIGRVDLERLLQEKLPEDLRTSAQTVARYMDGFLGLVEQS